MGAALGVTIMKRFTYRGATEDYSTTYWLTGDAPSTPEDWRTLYDALETNEHQVVPAAVSFIGGYGYDDDTGHKTGDTGSVSPAVWSLDKTVSPETPGVGSMAMTTQSVGPGDSAVWVRWKTSRLNTKGKPIYLRKYFHPGIWQSSGSPDVAGTTWKSNAGDYATKLTDGTLPNGHTITAAGHTDVILSHGVSQYLTTRTLKRRGKRPGS